MAFFPRSFYNTQNTNNTNNTSFTPLLRFLDDFDTYSRKTGSPNERQDGTSWQPKFDIRELAQAYELHGELPGLNKENVHVEFTDPQTMLIRGKVERTYTTGNSTSHQLEDNAKRGAITESETPKNNHKVTVEDVDETSTEEAKFQVVKPADEKAADSQKPVDNAKYWLTERNIGEFARVFHFPTRVEQDSVSANFQDGILSIVVPKAKKHESRRIVVN